MRLLAVISVASCDTGLVGSAHKLVQPCKCAAEGGDHKISHDCFHAFGEPARFSPTSLTCGKRGVTPRERHQISQAYPRARKWNSGQMGDLRSCRNTSRSDNEIINAPAYAPALGKQRDKIADLIIHAARLLNDRCAKDAMLMVK